MLCPYTFVVFAVFTVKSFLFSSWLGFRGADFALPQLKRKSNWAPHHSSVR
jgi:hypothetical protein